MTMTLIVPVLTFITTGLFVFALAPQQRISIRRRLAPYGSNAPAARDRLLGASFIDRVLVPAVKTTARLATLIAPSSIRAMYVLYLTQSGETISAPGLVLIAVLFIAGGRFSSWWVRRSIKRRQEQIERGLPTALDLITVCMEAGLSFDSGLAKVVEKTSGPLADEFARVLQEMQMGKVRREALRDMARRVEVRDMSALVAAIVQADQMGMSLSPVMRAQADDLRTRRRQRAEETAAKAPVKMLFPLILCILPSSMLVLLGPGIVVLFTQLLTQMNDW